MTTHKQNESFYVCNANFGLFYVAFKVKFTSCDEGVLGDKIHFLYEYTKLDDMRTKYISSCNRLSANVHNFTRMLHTNEPNKINNLATFTLYGLKLYDQ